MSDLYKFNSRNKNEMLENKVIDTITKFDMIKENDKIVLGVSGGPDSICLLNILNNIKRILKFDLVVAHINHMIRQEAESETEYVLNVCKSLDVECFVKRINVIEMSNKEKTGTEETGRKVRYEFFEEILNKVNANKIATAHNFNDNAETVLMNILRGTGTSGLKGIEPIRDNKFIRPLIECERSEIEKYCEKNNLEPKIDKSNYENIYTRNKIRNVLIPEIKKDFNPNIIVALNKLSNLAKQENDFIQRYSNAVLENELIIKNIDDRSIYDSSLVIDLKKFNNLDNVIKNRVILKSIEKVSNKGQGIEKIHVDDIVNMCSKNIGNKYLMPNKNVKVYINKGKIIFEYIDK